MKSALLHMGGRVFKSRRLGLALTFAPLCLLALSLAACDSDPDHPTGASDVVLRVEAGGGLVTPGYNLTQTPGFTLYGDGTVIVTGPMIEIYPQPALPNLQQTTLSRGQVARLLSAAKQAGLFSNGVDYGTPGVADVPTTTITINAEGHTYVSSIYALGFEQSLDGSSTAAEAVNGLTSEQVQARAAILDFTTQTGDLDTYLTTKLQWEQFAYTSLAVFSLAYHPSTATRGDAVQPNHLDWPLGDLSTAGAPVQPQGYRKVVVTGEDLTKLRPLLAQATQITLWKSGDHEYYLYFRPLLPDESA